MGFDEGVLAAPAGDDGIDVEAVVGDDLADVVGVEHEEARVTVLFLGIAGMADLLGKESGGGPEGAGEEAGGVGGGSHGQELALVVGRGDILGFVDDQQEGSGCADDIGGGVAGEERDASEVEQAHEVTVLAPAPGGEGVAGEELVEAEEGVEGLGFVGGIDDDDADGELGVEVEEVIEEVEDELVLAGLAGEDDDDGVTEVVVDGVEERGDGGELIWT